MVAYKLLRSILPLALLGLFIAGKVLESGELEEQVLEDLRTLFPPDTTRGTLVAALEQIRGTSTGFAIVILSGATINSIRFELHETGELRPKDGP